MNCCSCCCWNGCSLRNRKLLHVKSKPLSLPPPPQSFPFLPRPSLHASLLCPFLSFLRSFCLLKLRYEGWGVPYALRVAANTFRYMLSWCNVSGGNDFGSFWANRNVVIEVNLASRYIFQPSAPFFVLPMLWLSDILHTGNTSIVSSECICF